MLNDGDRRMVEIIAAAFREKVGTEKTENPRVAYGRELLGIENNTPVAGIWWGFFVGFGAGIEFMAEDEKT